MSRIILAPNDYQDFDTTSAPASVTLDEVIGKQYVVSNTGTGGNILTVNYGANVIELEDGQTFSFIYNGTQWSSLSGSGGGGTSTIEADLGEAVGANKLVYFDTDGKLYLADSTNPLKSFVAGVTLTGGVLDDTVEAQKANVLEGFTGLTTGADYYLSTAGDIDILANINATTQNVVYVGRAISTTALDLNIKSPEIATVPKDFDAFIGIFVPFGGLEANIPTGMVGCLGQTLLVADYPKLYGVIGNTHGGTPGVDFVVPNMQGISTKGKGTQDVNGRTKGNPALSEGDIWEDEMQRITGSFVAQVTVGESDGAFSDETESGTNASPGGTTDSRVTFDSSDSPDARTSATTDGETHGTEMIVNYVMYVGNGSLSYVVDTALDARVTALENAGLFGDYDEWERGESTVWNSQSITVTHNLNCYPKDMLIDVQITNITDGIDWQQTGYLSHSVNQYGYVIEHGSATLNSFNIITAAQGMLLLNSSGILTGALGDGDNGNMRVQMRKASAVSFLNAQNAFINKKDWVEVFSNPDGVTSLNHTFGTGLFEVVFETTGTGGNTYTWLLNLSDFSMTTKYQYYVAAGTSASTGSINYTNGVYGFSVSGSATVTIGIKSIRKWQDTTGSDKPSVPLKNGYEEVYYDPTNTADIPVAALSEFGTGLYKCTVDWTGSAWPEQSILFVEVTDVNEKAFSQTFHSATTTTNKVYASYENSAFGATGSASWTGACIKKIEKATDRLTLDINHTRSHTTGTPQQWYDEYAPAGSDEDYSARLAELTALAVSGDRLTISNNGTDPDAYIINGPNGDVIVQQMTSDYIYSATDGWKLKSETGHSSLAFHVGMSADDTVNAGIPFIWDDVYFDNGNNYNGTNGRYVVPKSGMYLFSFSVRTVSLGIVALYVNGTAHTRVASISDSSGAVSIPIQLEKDDYVDIRPPSASETAQGGDSHFSGHYVGK